MYNGQDAISSGGVSTGTGFRSVAKPDLHSAMLVVKRVVTPAGLELVLSLDKSYLPLQASRVG